MKYELTDKKIEIGVTTLYQIKALKNFSDVKAGDLGGYIKKESNLSQEGNCWVYDQARVYDNAVIFNNARVYDKAVIFGDAFIYDNAMIFDNAHIYGNTILNGDCTIRGDTRICNVTMSER